MNTRTKVPTSAAAAPRLGIPEAALPEAVRNIPLDTAPATVKEVKPPKLYPAKIAAAIIKITREIGKITKQGENKFHGYTYAKWEDILDKLAPMIADNGLIIIPNEIAHNVFDSLATIAITYDFTIINEDGDVWPDKPRQTQLCKIRDGKGVIDDKAASKCFTQAQKYMMIALFKIRTQDMADADADDQTPARRRRSVPSSSGKRSPELITIIDGERPEAWAKRFIEAISKAETEIEIDEWDRLNTDIIDRKIKPNYPDTYNQIVEALDSYHQRVQPKAQSKVINNETALTLEEKDWLVGLEGAFSGCEGIVPLDAEHDRLMEPQRGKVSEAAWQKAIDLYDTRREQIERDN